MEKKTPVKLKPGDTVGYTEGYMQGAHHNAETSSAHGSQLDMGGVMQSEYNQPIVDHSYVEQPMQGGYPYGGPDHLARDGTGSA